MDIDMQLFKDQVAKALAESIEALAGNAVLTAEDVSHCKTTFLTWRPGEEYRVRNVLP